jgi:hypothetical protein
MTKPARMATVAISGNVAEIAYRMMKRRAGSLFVGTESGRRVSTMLLAASISPVS